MYDPVFNETFNIYNVKQERSPKWFDNGGEPIWVTNQLQDDCNCRKTGVVFWPGDSASVKGVLPSSRRYPTTPSNPIIISFI
jgi:ectonucleotide pyrophosphatase/phosphodiesterase family protein 5